MIVNFVVSPGCFEDTAFNKSLSLSIFFSSTLMIMSSSFKSAFEAGLFSMIDTIYAPFCESRLRASDIALLTF